MTEASSVTCNKVQDFMDGSMLFEIAGTVTSGYTLTIPTTGDGSIVNTSTKVQIVAYNDMAKNRSSATSATYTAASRLFTVVGGAAATDRRILFKAKNE